MTEIPAPQEGAIIRPRLVSRLRERFEKRVSAVHGPAGYGKTTLLAQAIHENRFEKLGDDVYIRVRLLEGGRGGVLGRVAEALGDELPDQPKVDDLCMRVWSRAPEELAIVIDDVHHLDTDGWDELGHLARNLPANGHLVLAGREIGAPFGSTISIDDRITEDDLALDPGERHELAVATGWSAVDDDLPAWPALAVLTTVARHRASLDLLWEAVLRDLDPGRRRVLALAACFDAVDDDLLGAIAPGCRFTLPTLTADLPMVERDGSSVRLHDLLRRALASEVDATDRKLAIRRGAPALLARGAWLRAATAAALIDDHALIRAAVDHLIEAPGPFAGSQVRQLIDLLPDVSELRPRKRFLEGYLAWSEGHAPAVRAFRIALEAAEQAGDQDLAARAAWRLAQLDYLEDPTTLSTSPGTAALAEAQHPLAAAVAGFIRSVEATLEGDVHHAFAALAPSSALGDEQAAVLQASRAVALARPEAVDVTLDDVLAGTGPGPLGAQSLWLRGEVEPALAWTFAQPMVGAISGRGVPYEAATTLCVVATIGLAAGEYPEARALLDRADALRERCPAMVTLFIDTVDAVCALVENGEEEAESRLASATESSPIHDWPLRAHIHTMATMRALVPACRRWDRTKFGPAIATAAAAGDAIGALRERGDGGPATMLPWAEPSCLWAHVPSPFLTELACAAAAAGDVDALAVLDAVPDLDRWLVRIASKPTSEAVRVHASERLEAMPSRPRFTLRVRTLGELALVRTDGRAIGEAWARRERVRELFELLLLRPSQTRTEIAAQMWPDQDSDAASANLRATLRHLRTSIAPELPGGDRWFVRTTGSSIYLHDDGLEVDRDELDRLVRMARDAETAGVPSTALAQLRDAAELYAGTFCPDSVHADTELERIRIESLAHRAAVRAGELELARGEPENAMPLAQRALSIDPLSQRAFRLLLRAHLAIGSTSAAAGTANVLRKRLADAGAEVESDTQRILDRLTPG